jgi:hypothetical protein
MTKERIKYGNLIHLAAGTMLEHIKEEEEREYFESLASQYVASKAKNYNLARSIVLDLHNLEESYMQLSIVALCANAGFKLFSLDVDLPNLLEVIIGMSCYQKIKIVEALRIFSAVSMRTIKELNRLRNAFAHGYKNEDTEYNYKGKTIFQRKTIECLITDHKRILSEFEGLLNKIKDT